MGIRAFLYFRKHHGMCMNLYNCAFLSSMLPTSQTLPHVKSSLPKQKLVLIFTKLAIPFSIFLMLHLVWCFITRACGMLISSFIEMEVWRKEAVRRKRKLKEKLGPIQRRNRTALFPGRTRGFLPSQLGQYLAQALLPFKDHCLSLLLLLWKATSTQNKVRRRRSISVYSLQSVIRGSYVGTRRQEQKQRP